MVLEATSLKPRYWQRWFLLGTLREDLFQASIPAPGIFWQSWLVNASLQSLSPSSHGILLSVSLSKCLSSYKDTSPWIRAHPFYRDYICKFCFQIRSHSQIPRVMTSTYLLLETQFNHIPIITQMELLIFHLSICISLVEPLSSFWDM